MKMPNLFKVLSVGFMFLSPVTSFASSTQGQTLHVTVKHGNTVVQETNLPYVVSRSEKNVFNGACDTNQSGCISEIGINLSIPHAKSVMVDICHNKYFGTRVFHKDGNELLLPNVGSTCYSQEAIIKTNVRTGEQDFTFKNKDWSVLGTVLDVKNKGTNRL